MEEDDLLGRARTGDKDALISLIMHKRNEYYRLAYVYLGNQEDVLDALQDMIVIIYENIRKLRNTNAFLSWSKTILVNICKKKLRKKGKIVFIEYYSESMEGAEQLKAELPHPEIKLDITKGLNQLNEHQKEAIILKYFLDMSHETIAEITKTPVGTVKSRIFNGLKRLKEIMGGDDYGRD